MQPTEANERARAHAMGAYLKLNRMSSIGKPPLLMGGRPP